jgi:uncharacterized membrane protein
MKKLLLILIFISTGAYAGLFDNRLQQYRCKDAEQAYCQFL